MADPRSSGLLDSLRQWLGGPHVAPLPDAQLLELFIARRDENAFATLLQRHGPMVLGVCRRLLDDKHDAEDVFQATFLVLVRRAAAIRNREALGSWLYGVACHLAAKVRGRSARQQALEQRVPPMQTQDPSSDAAWRELRPILDDELGKLPNKYRTPLVLCYLEGRTNEEAAEELRLPSGTVKSRLARGREMLRDKLQRRGLALPLGIISIALAENAAAEVPPALTKTTLHAAVTGSVAAPVTILVEGMVRTMLMAKLKLVGTVLVTIGLLSLGTGLALRGAGAAPPGHSAAARQALAEQPGPVAQPAPAAQEPANAKADDANPNPVIFPRRLLALVPVNYVYANPIRFPSATERSPVQNLASLLHIADDQVAVLSDRAPKPQPPIKSMLELNLVRFIDSCREEDRIIILFVGHAVTIGGKNYLVPLDGDPKDSDTLIPLSWVYDRLKWCKARQKVLVVDVCRKNPVRGNERGEVEKMSDTLDEMLEKPPTGVQVLTACVGGQYSIELENQIVIGEASCGVMLDQLSDLRLKGGMRGVIQRPEDSIPMQPLATSLRVRSQAVAKTFFKTDQTVRLSGAEAFSKLLFDPKLRPAPKFEIQFPPEWTEGSATAKDLAALFSTIKSLPSIRPFDQNTLSDLLDSLPPYPKRALAPYKEEERDSILRDKVLEGIKLLTDNKRVLQQQFVAAFNLENAQQVNQFRNGIAEIQKSTSVMQFKLDSALEELNSLGEERAKETKRWQTLYDFVRARLAARITVVYEYNVALGQLRKDFPEMDPQIHKGWQLAAHPDIRDNDAAKYASQARKLLDKIVQENQGTPWELIARRERITALGLKWVPLPK